LNGGSDRSSYSSRTRRGFLIRSAVIAATAFAPALAPGVDSGGVKRDAGVHLKLALNAYSFNGPLSSGKMTLDDVINYCAQQNIDGLDPTGYYFTGYPKVPLDEYLYQLKRKAYLNGVTLSGTGVRNNFTLVNQDALGGEVQLVKDWIVAAGPATVSGVTLSCASARPGRGPSCRFR
jgi:hypothetical protein